jgi:glycine/D-amino acid oxidase-like deaminating enzyme
VTPGLRAARVGAGGRVRLDGGGELRADVVVHAGDHGAGAVEPWLADKLWPVRLTHQRWAAEGPARPFSAGQSWVWAGPDGAGGLVGGGCRWACPHLEVGEVDPGRLRDDVVQKLDLVVPALVPGLAGAPVSHRWAEIATLTCDGLPLVGPLPGRPQELACLGLQGRPWSLGPAAAEAVLAGLLGDGGPRVPRCLLPGRFVGR